MPTPNDKVIPHLRRHSKKGVRNPKHGLYAKMLLIGLFIMAANGSILNVEKRNGSILKHPENEYYSWRHV